MRSIIFARQVMFFIGCRLEESGGETCLSNVANQLTNLGILKMDVAGALQILAQTPVYVWLLLSYLAWQGLAATRTRTRPLWRPLTVPLIFAVFGIWPLIGKSALDIKLVAIWLGAGLLLALPGVVTGPRVIAQDAVSREVTISGSIVPLVRNMTLFVLHYALAVGLALNPEGTQILTMAGYALSGGSVGYFAGWAFTFHLRLDGSR